MHLAGALLTLMLVIAGVWLMAAWDTWLRAPVTPAQALVRPVAAVLRDLGKEFRATERPDRLLWLAGPLLLVTAVMAALVVMPLAPGVIGADLSVGVVYFTAMFALVVVAVFITAWGPNSKYALVAGYRFVGLMLAYEMPFAITIIAVALPAQSLALGDIVAAQQAVLWNAVLQPVGLALYLVCAMALAFRGPFAVVDSPDIAGGATVELSGAPLLVWRFGRHALLLALSALAVPLFFGGAALFGVPPVIGSLVKTAVVSGALVWLSSRLARMRLAWFMERAWVVLIPLSLANLFLVGLLMLLFPDYFAAGGQ